MSPKELYDFLARADLVTVNHPIQDLIIVKRIEWNDNELILDDIIIKEDAAVQVIFDGKAFTAYGFVGYIKAYNLKEYPNG